MYTGLPLIPATTPDSSSPLPLKRATMKLVPGSISRRTPTTSTPKRSGSLPENTDRP